MVDDRDGPDPQPPDRKVVGGEVNSMVGTFTFGFGNVLTVPIAFGVWELWRLRGSHEDSRSARRPCP